MAWFHATIDGHDLGFWTECTGLSAHFKMDTWEEGGVNGHTHQLPGRLEYDAIKLKRWLDQQAGAVLAWLKEVRDGSYSPGTGSISLYHNNLDEPPTATWDLRHVIPVRWNGPSLTVDEFKLVEELELTHHGFI